MATVLEEVAFALRRVLDYYAAHGCPCAYPRFTQLAGFHFRAYTNGPVGLHPAEMLAGLACADDGPLPPQGGWDGPTRAHRCRVCGSLWRRVFEEFSSSMQLSSLQLESAGTVCARGALPEKQIPLPYDGGFFAFSSGDIEACKSQMWRDGTCNDLVAYLTALDLTSPPRRA